jgi:hypothetical protein
MNGWAAWIGRCVIEELFGRGLAADDRVVDELVAERVEPIFNDLGETSLSVTTTSSPNASSWPIT